MADTLEAAAAAVRVAALAVVAVAAVVDSVDRQATALLTRFWVSRRVSCGGKGLRRNEDEASILEDN